MTNSNGGGGNFAAFTYERPEGLPGMKEAGGDDDDNDDGGRGERQGQEEAEGKEEILILHRALAVPTITMKMCWRRGTRSWRLARRRNTARQTTTGRRVRKRWQQRREEGRSVEEGALPGDGRGKDG